MIDRKHKLPVAHQCSLLPAMTPKFTLPEWLSSRERAAEVATLLATAIARVHAGRSGQKERLFGCASNL
jgi:hypothetical protein